MFSPLPVRFVLKDSQHVGQILADKPKSLFKSGKIDGLNFDPSSILIFGIPRGGLIVADEIAKKLNWEVDLIYPIIIVALDQETTWGSILCFE